METNKSLKRLRGQLDRSLQPRLDNAGSTEQHKENNLELVPGKLQLITNSVVTPQAHILPKQGYLVSGTRDKCVKARSSADAASCTAEGGHVYRGQCTDACCEQGPGSGTGRRQSRGSGPRRGPGSRTGVLLFLIVRRDPELLVRPGRSVGIREVSLGERPVRARPEPGPRPPPLAAAPASPAPCPGCARSARRSRTTLRR